VAVFGVYNYHPYFKEFRSIGATLKEIPQRETVALESKSVPADWRTLEQEKWSIAYPSSIEPIILEGIPDEFQTVLFPMSKGDEQRASAVEVTYWRISTSPLRSLIETLQRDQDYSVIEALLFINRYGLKETDKTFEGSSTITMDRFVSLRELRGGQFAYEEPDGDMKLRTLFVQGDILYDLSVSSIPEYSSVEQDELFEMYETMLSSFQAFE